MTESNALQIIQRVDICGAPLKTRWHDKWNCAPWWQFWDPTSGWRGGAIVGFLVWEALIGLWRMFT